MRTRSALCLSLLAVGCTATPEESDVSSGSAALSLPGSQFEIDDDANLVANDASLDDWATVGDSRVTDSLSGQSDTSYAGGAKESDTCPSAGTGSIPNNKSDLKAFGVYVEPGDPGFIHLFWTRVQDPSGTTLLDFEFNQNGEDCGNGVNPVRTEGDLLIEYRLEQGGSVATLKARHWSGSAWDAATDLTAISAATGTTNTSAISAANSDGLGALSARTFGEASISTDFLFDSGSCTAFGSAFVKSRSSDSFTSALKDFIAPVPINLSNCGQVIIRKETDPDGYVGSFGFTHNLVTDPVSSTSFDLSDGESETFANVLLGEDYTVGEDALGSDLELVDIDCSASSGVDVVTDLEAGAVAFDIDADGDLVDCTFTNQAKGTIIVEKVTSDDVGTFSFGSDALGAFNLTTSAAGEAGLDSETFANLDPGSYGVSEDVPAGWLLASATCDDGSSPANISLAAGETVTCRFTNERQRGAIKILKTRSHAALGAGPHPHASVTFLVSGGALSVPVPVVTDAQGEACVDGLLLSDVVGGYSVTEVLPTGYVPAGDLIKPVSVTAVASCPNGDQVTFHNTPLTNITVSVDSQIAGGTSSVISCDGVDPVPTDTDGDGSVMLSDLAPGTYTCQVVVSP